MGMIVVFQTIAQKKGSASQPTRCKLCDLKTSMSWDVGMLSHYNCCVCLFVVFLLKERCSIEAVSRDIESLHIYLKE